MSDEAINSWIFLAVAMASNESPVTLNGIIGVADGINHAIPTHKELQDAFGWLLKQDLISKESKKYQLTEKGFALYKEADAKSNLISGMWDFLKKHFLALESEANINSLTVEELDIAYNKYNKKFWKEHRRCNES